MASGSPAKLPIVSYWLSQVGLVVCKETTDIHVCEANKCCWLWNRLEPLGPKVQAYTTLAMFHSPAFAAAHTCINNDDAWR